MGCRDGAMGLTLDPQLIRDLTVLIGASTVGGALFEAVRQPIINGYFIAGSLVGPGGLRLIKVGQEGGLHPSYHVLHGQLQVLSQEAYVGGVHSSTSLSLRVMIMVAASEDIVAASEAHGGLPTSSCSTPVIGYVSRVRTLRTAWGHFLCA